MENEVENGESLGVALPKQMARVRDQVLPAYDAIGPAGSIAATMMRHALDCASKALAEGDVIAMLRAHESLKGYRT